MCSRRRGFKRAIPSSSCLKRRYQFWIAALACSSSAACYPGDRAVQKKDIVYRVQASSARAVICVEEPEVRAHVQAAAAECDTLLAVYTLCDAEGFLNFDRMVDEAGRALGEARGTARERRHHA
jgi:acyl-coenzyme A synthetase/AMP-(fatty) acid ligase